MICDMEIAKLEITPPPSLPAPSDRSGKAARPDWARVSLWIHDTLYTGGRYAALQHTAMQHTATEREHYHLFYSVNLIF